VTTIIHAPLPTIINGKAPPASESANPGKPGMPGIETTQEAPAGPVDLVENLVSFDPERVQLEWQQGNWQLRVDGLLIRDYGRHEQAARQMQMLIRQLRLTQYGFVGQPRPALEYWLCNGQAPQGILLGLRTFALDQTSLRVEKALGQWCVRDAYQLMLGCERNEETARQALAILRKYRFSQAAVVGPGMSPILLLLARPDLH
jgi:hypothetical protein